MNHTPLTNASSTFTDYYKITASLNRIIFPALVNYPMWLKEIMSPRHVDRLICDVILDQEVLPGVGNIIKNEALFDAGGWNTSLLFIVRFSFWMVLLGTYLKWQFECCKKNKIFRQNIFESKYFHNRDVDPDFFLCGSGSGSRLKIWCGFGSGSRG